MVWIESTRGTSTKEKVTGRGDLLSRNKPFTVSVKVTEDRPKGMHEKGARRRSTMRPGTATAAETSRREKHTPSAGGADGDPGLSAEVDGSECGATRDALTKASTWWRQCCRNISRRLH